VSTCNLSILTHVVVDFLIKEQVSSDDVHTYEITGSGEAVLAAERDRLALLSHLVDTSAK